MKRIERCEVSDIIGQNHKADSFRRVRLPPLSGAGQAFQLVMWSRRKLLRGGPSALKAIRPVRSLGEER
jgi:hypothetical protein